MERNPRKQEKKEKPTATGTLGWTDTGDDSLWGWSEEVIDLPNGDKIYVTPNTEEMPDGGVKKYIQDMPVDMVFERYGVDIYAEEYVRRFKRKKHNVDIFKKSDNYQRMTMNDRPSFFGRNAPVIEDYEPMNSEEIENDEIIDNGLVQLEEINDLNQFDGDKSSSIEMMEESKKGRCNY